MWDGRELRVLVLLLRDAHEHWRPRRLSWTGIVGKEIQPEGRYAFRAVVQQGGVTATSAAADNTERDAFDFYWHFFPVRGKHNYGSSGARFGAGRSGHTHQGQDVLANCGLKLVAAQGGTVVYSGYQSAAGNYIVIDNDGTADDFVYMHLATPAYLKTDGVVAAGQQIGVVGETGDATGCHLHFEYWQGDWYGGGHPIDPLPYLKAWDSTA